MELTPTQLALWSAAWMAAGWLLNHFLTIGRERSKRLREFRKTIYVLISEIEESDHGASLAVLQRSKDTLSKERAATAEDVRWWRRGRFENACIQYCNQQKIGAFARQATDTMFEGISEDMGTFLAEWKDVEVERKWAVNALKRLIRLAKSFP
jgi:hypothetical protein